MLLDVARKIGNTTYQFQMKGHEHQYKLNYSVEEAISSAHTELTKVKPSTPEGHKENYKVMDGKLNKLEEDLATAKAQ